MNQKNRNIVKARALFVNGLLLLTCCSTALILYAQNTLSIVTSFIYSTCHDGYLSLTTNPKPTNPIPVSNPNSTFAVFFGIQDR